jgi:hypothetical protein
MKSQLAAVVVFCAVAASSVFAAEMLPITYSEFQAKHKLPVGDVTECDLPNRLKAVQIEWGLGQLKVLGVQSGDELRIYAIVRSSAVKEKEPLEAKSKLAILEEAWGGPWNLVKENSHGGLSAMIAIAPSRGLSAYIDRVNFPDHPVMSFGIFCTEYQWLLYDQLPAEAKAKWQKPPLLVKFE